MIRIDSANVKAQVGAFNQEKALVVGAFSVIVKIDGSFAALIITLVCVTQDWEHSGGWEVLQGDIRAGR